MYINVLLLPLLSFIICSLFGRNIGYNGTKIVSSFLLFLSSLISLFIFLEVNIYKSNSTIYLWDWFNIGILNNSFTLTFDSIVSSMLILVTTVSFLVHVFSTSYMDGDPHLPRFMSYLSLFTFFMIVLVTASNLVQLFIGWEGVGLCSYLLISFWYTRIQANKSAIKAMIINKIGDIGLLLGIIMIWIFAGSLNYNTIFSISLNLCNKTLIELMSILLLIGVIGKSAQIGLHTWLPDAMEGPTPVSALIHAATMVTAGVFLIIRMSPFFENASSVLLIIVLLGSLTAFFSSSIGLAQNDLKKVVAYSTCSQLGYMVMICGFSYYNLGLFHLINHGFFKALLFLSSGSIIHALTDEQDLRKMGNMKIVTPFSYICILIGSISLMGLPFLTGFYSKDLILELIYGEYYLSYALWLGLIAASATAFYSFRLIYYTFLGHNQNSIEIFNKSHEGEWNLTLPLILLLICSIVIGYFLQVNLLGDEIPVMITNNYKFLPLWVSLIGATLSILMGFYVIKWYKYSLNSFMIKVYSFLNGAWYFDFIYNNYITRLLIKFGFNTTYKLIDNQLLEYLGPTKSFNQLTKITNILSLLHVGRVSLYIMIFVLFVSCFAFKF